MILCSIIMLDGIIEIVFGQLFNYKISDRILYVGFMRSEAKPLHTNFIITIYSYIERNILNNK